jgi:hypothetical protein
MSDVKVPLPTGCYGVETADGAKYDRQGSGYVEMPEHHAAQIARSRHGQTGLLSTTRGYALATRGGRRCPGCRFLGQVWSITCPHCGTPTEME